MKGIAVQDKFQQTAIAEMKHAGRLLKGYGTYVELQRPSPEVGESMKEFLELDTKAEVEAIEMH